MGVLDFLKSTTPINGGNPLTFEGAPLLKNTAAQGSASSLYFPSDLGQGNFNYWMSFTFYNYQRPTITSAIGAIMNGSSFLQSTVLEDKGTIRLPLPNSMVDHQDQEYTTESITEVASRVIGVNVSSNLLSSALGAAGYAANPFLAVMYKQPSFKSHNFSWRLTPSNEEETLKLNQIVNNFRANQLPHGTKYGGYAVLGYPNIVQVTISNNNPDTFSYVFRPALIRSFEVNFTPEGQPSFFNSTKGPTAVEIRMNLMEIEYWTQEDYGVTR